MKNKLSLAIACGVATMCIATTSFASEKTFNIGGDIELDMTGSDNGESSVELVGGRAKLNAVGMVTGDSGHFAKGVVQPIVKFSDGTLASDDVYFQFGKTNSWDLQLGRFEAINLLPLGKDTLVVKATDAGYSAGNFRGRQGNAAALHVGSADKFLFELGVVYSKDGDTKTSAVRPAMTYKAGSMTFHAGIESANNDFEGFGVGVSAGIGAGSANLSYASGGFGDNEDSSIALNYTQGSWGVGLIHDEVDTSDFSQDTLYAAYTMPLLGLKDASVTFAGSTSSADGAEDVNAARVRFNYTF